MNVCFPFVGDSIGGSQKSSLLLIGGLDRSKFRPLVVLHRGDGPLAAHLRAHAIPYDVLSLPDLAGSKPSVASIFIAQLRCFGRLRSYLRAREIDIVHTNDLRCNLSWGLVSRIYARHVWHQRTLLSKSMFWQLMGMLTNHVICISATVRRTYRSFAPVTVQANPFTVTQIDRVLAKQALAAELNVDPGKPIVGYIGRLVPGKGLGEIEALPALLPEATVVVAGTGPLEPFLSPAIRRLGFRDPIEAVIAGLDVLIAPSREEGFGRTVVEAMLAGTPVVASDIPAHREASSNGRYAILVPYGNARAIAAAIHELMGCDSKASAFASRAKEFACSRYSIGEHVEGIESIYSVLTGT